jgi:hypothetical protein
MTTYYLNGTALQEGANFIMNGMSYPYSWLENTSPSVRASLGIEKDGDVNFDPKYYWGVNNPKSLEDVEEVDADGNPAYVKVFDASVGEFGSMIDSDKRMVTKGLKTACTSEVKSTVNNLLSPTDYYVVRNSVEDLKIPESISEYRAAVIAEQNRVVPAIAATTTVEELIEVMNSITWPRAE